MTKDDAEDVMELGGCAPAPKKWPTCPSENSKEEVDKFLAAAWSRLHPDSDADVAERAFLAGQLIGLCSRLMRERGAHAKD